MKILDRLPISQTDTLTFVDAESVRLKKDQIIVWVSLTRVKDSQWNPATPHFPAILDTGHTHNFAIQNQHLIRWARIQSNTLRTLGSIRHEGKRVPFHAARLWLHRNERGTAAVLSNDPVFLDLLGGIAVYPDDSNYPRLPLLGLRAILSNRLHFAIDGERTSVTLHTPGLRTRLLFWLT
jgi:hypothetical protein